MKLKFTEEQVFDLASKIYDRVNEGEGFAELKEQNAFVKKDWVDAAHDAIEGYNTVAKYIDFPAILFTKNDCSSRKIINTFTPECTTRR